MKLVHALIQRPHHAVDKWMVVFAVEAVKPVIKPAEADRIQRQARHVGRNVHGFIRIEPSPFLDQLHGNIHHFRVIALHRTLAEAGEQNVMGFFQFGSCVALVNNPSPRMGGHSAAVPRFVYQTASRHKRP